MYHVCKKKRTRESLALRLELCKLHNEENIYIICSRIWQGIVRLWVWNRNLVKYNRIYLKTVDCFIVSSDFKI